MTDIEAYKELVTFMLKVTAPPQCTAVVERTFSKLYNNKTKLKNALGVHTMEAIAKVIFGRPTFFDTKSIVPYFFFGPFAPCSPEIMYAKKPQLCKRHLCQQMFLRQIST